jgi:hypothetical protein
MKGLFLFSLLICSSFSLETLAGCIFGKAKYALDTQVHNGALNSNRYIAGVVTHVLNAKPANVDGQLDFITNKWDINDETNEIWLVLSNFNSKNVPLRYLKGCDLEFSRNKIYVKITNFDSSNLACKNRLFKIQDKRRRVGLFSCIKSPNGMYGKPIYVFDNSKLKEGYIVSYKNTEDKLFRYHYEMAKRMRNNFINKKLVDGKLECILTNQCGNWLTSEPIIPNFGATLNLEIAHYNSLLSDVCAGGASPFHCFGDFAMDDANGGYYQFQNFVNIATDCCPVNEFVDVV